MNIELDARKQQGYEPQDELLRRAKSGDQAAMEAIVASFDRFVAWIASDHVRPTAPLEDLMQAGRIGLIEAIRRFDPTRGTKLSTYAKSWIEGEVRSAARDPDFIRLRGKSAELFFQIKEAVEELGAGGGAVSLDGLADSLRVDPSELEPLLRAAQQLEAAEPASARPASTVRKTHAVVPDERKRSVDQVKRALKSYAAERSRLEGPRQDFDRERVSGTPTSGDSREPLFDLEGALSRLDDPLFDVIELREFYGLQVKEAADWLNVHENTVRNRYKRAIAQLCDYVSGVVALPAPRRKLTWAADLEPVESIVAVVRRYRPMLEVVFQDPFFDEMEIGWILRDDEGWVPIFSRDIEETARRMRRSTRSLPSEAYER